MEKRTPPTIHVFRVLRSWLYLVSAKLSVISRELRGYSRSFCWFVLISLALDPCCWSQGNPTPASVQTALGIQESLNQLSALNQQGQGASLTAMNLRQDILEKITQASFAFDSVVSRIQAEIAYTAETRALLENRAKRQESHYDLASFLAGGVFGATGSAMQLAGRLNRAGTAVGVGGFGSVLVLALAHWRAGTPKEPVHSPFNMLAQILGVPPNNRSEYPPVVVALLSVPGPEGGMYVSRLPAQWRQLNRLQTNDHGKKGSSVQILTSDADEHILTTANELADREAMLLDLSAALLRIRSNLGLLLDEVRQH